MNSTIKPRKKKCVCGCNKEGYIFSKGMLKECWAKQHNKPIKRVSDKRMGRDFSEESWANLRNELDATFSKYIHDNPQESLFVAGLLFVVYLTIRITVAIYKLVQKLKATVVWSWKAIRDFINSL